MTTTVDGQQVEPRLVAALDLLHLREREADHVALDLAERLEHCPGLASLTIGTHAATVGTLRHVALTVVTVGVDADTLWEALRAVVGEFDGLMLDGRFVGPPELRPTLDAVLAEQAGRTNGRVVVFPGHTTLTGTVTVGHVLGHTAVDDVRVLADDARPPAGTGLVTRDFVRPRWRAGRLVLDTQPARGGVLVPFETPNPTPCCADHA